MNLPPHGGGWCPACPDSCGHECYDCEAEGHDDYCEEYETDHCPNCPECEVCEGAGDVLWEWDPDIEDDAAKCSECGAEDVDTMGYREDGEDGHVCLACYLEWHAKSCGCDKWPKEVEP